MCACYLQTYEILLKELNSHLGSDEVQPDQYLAECVALADSNFNVPCEWEAKNESSGYHGLNSPR
jgi:hypothetical protein